MHTCRKIPSCVILVALIYLAPTPASLGQERKPVTLEDLIQMKNAGLDEPTIVKAIEANGAGVDTSAQGLIALKKAGFGDAVIQAALDPAAPARKFKSGSDIKGVTPEELGAYAVVGGALQQLPTEIVSLKSRGMFKAMATAGISKSKINGSVPGVTSSLRLSPPLEILLRIPEGTAPNEYQMLTLNSEKNCREFTAGKSGITGASLGDVAGNAVEAKFERVERSVYRAVFPKLKRGEYGLLAPGLDMTKLAAAGKMYTFSVVD